MCAMWDKTVIEIRKTQKLFSLYFVLGSGNSWIAVTFLVLDEHFGCLKYVPKRLAPSHLFHIWID